MTTTTKSCRLWLPETSAPAKVPRDLMPRPSPMPETPIGMDFASPTDDTDVHILSRAMHLAGIHERAVPASRLARPQDGYREMTDYRIEYKTGGRTLLLERPLPRGALNGTPSADGPWTVDAIQVVATLKDPASIGTEELVMPVDIAFADAQTYGGATTRILLAPSGDDGIKIEDLAAVMSKALFTPNHSDSVETQYDAFQAKCYRRAALMLKPRPKALQCIVLYEVSRTLENCFENGESMVIKVRQTPAGLVVMAAAP